MQSVSFIQNQEYNALRISIKSLGRPGVALAHSTPLRSKAASNDETWRERSANALWILKAHAWGLMER
jgi:hypothetical protein